MKNCPFCGSENVRLEEWDSQLYTINCDDCGASGPFSSDEEIAEELWNTRVSDEE